MRLPVWIHNVTSAYPGGGGLPADDSLLPFDAVYGKTNDGLRFQTTWDSHGSAIDSVGAVVRAERDIYGPQGIDYIPWGVVHGRWEGETEYAAREGFFAGEIAKAATVDGMPPVYIVDLEPHYHAPFPAFWRDDLRAGPREVAEFVRGFAETVAQRGELWLAVDAREPHLEPVSFRAWIGHDVVTRVLPMVYFTDFVRPRVADNSDALTAILSAVNLLDADGVLPPAIYPIFPGDALPSAMVYAIETAQERGCGGVSIWQRGNLRLDTAEAIAAMDDPWEEEDEPVHDHAGAVALLNEIEGRLTNEVIELGLINEVVAQVRRDLEVASRYLEARD